MSLVSAKSYKQGASNESKQEGFDAVCGTRDTPKFWPWPGKGNFCHNDYASWGDVGSFGAVLQRKIKFLLLIFMMIRTGVCITQSYLSGA